MATYYPARLSEIIHNLTYTITIKNVILVAKSKAILKRRYLQHYKNNQPYNENSYFFKRNYHTATLYLAAALVLIAPYWN